jgi:hypothetical protein
MNLQPVTVYLPHPLQRSLHIDAGSAIVATPRPDWEAGQYGCEPPPDGSLMVVDYEGDRLGGAHPTLADRAHAAHGRHTEHYPTSARCWLPIEQLRPIGTYDPVEGDIALINDPDVRLHLAAWLGRAVDSGTGVPPESLEAQLHTTGNVRHQQRREIRAARKDPARFPPQVVRWYARRFGHEDLLP